MNFKFLFNKYKKFSSVNKKGLLIIYKNANDSIRKTISPIPVLHSFLGSSDEQTNIV